VNTEQTGRVVLVVEDEWLVRAEIASALHDAGWEVLEAGSAEAAIAQVGGGHRVGVIFTDIQLQGRQNGWDVAEAFRVAFPETAVIYTSGNAPDRSRSVEGSRFFDKPYSVSEVLEACEAFVVSGGRRN